MFKQIFIIYPKKDLNTNSSYLNTYHPYWREGEKNSKFNNFSKSILDLKEKKQEVIDSFFQELDSILNKDFPIINVPSSDPQHINTGINQVALLLAQQGRIDATYCLQRYKKVEKKSNGGNRDINVDLNSIKVINADMVKGQTILLLDDVTTTGNSFRSCQILLEQAGAVRVVKLALGKTASY